MKSKQTITRSILRMNSQSVALPIASKCRLEFWLDAQVDLNPHQIEAAMMM